jgi:flagellar motor switch protein FliG
MGIARYLKDQNGLREYVVFLEEMPPNKRLRFADSAKQENEKFVAVALEHVLTFDKLVSLPDMEVTEIFASVAPKMTAYATRSLDDAKKSRVEKLIPANKKIEIKSYEADNPSIQEQNVARFACIKAARALEKKGVLKSIRIPSIVPGQF